MNQLTEKRDLHDQIRYLERLIERLVTAVIKVRSNFEADKYADALRDLVSYTRISVAMKSKDEAQKEIGFLRDFISSKIEVYEDEWRRVDEALHNLTPRAEA